MSNELFPMSAELIFPRDAILNYSEVAEFDTLFYRGPFEDIPEEHQVDPLVEGTDYIRDMGCQYQTIVSCGGRIACGRGDNELLGPDILAFAAEGGWDEDMGYREIWAGGADVLPDYVTIPISDGLLNMLGRTSTGFDFEGRIVPRELIWRAYIIFRAGPTVMPW